jgi:hypothetical protein
MTSPDSPLEPHIEFNFLRRLKEEVELREPKQPFPGEPLCDELADVADPASPPPIVAPLALNSQQGQVIHLRGKRPNQSMHARLAARNQALRAAEREERFFKIQAAFKLQRQEAAAGKQRGAILVNAGGPMNHGLIEDHEYELSELVGPQSRFRFRLIPWAGA